MSFRIETKFLLESISQIFHLGKVAAFVVSEHALENIDRKKRLELETLLHIGIWSVDKIVAEISKTNLFRRAYCRMFFLLEANTNARMGSFANSEQTILLRKAGRLR